MKLSIIVPIYKDGDLLREYLKRIKAQVNKNYELILVIDTARDGTLEAVDEFKSVKPNIKVIFNSMRQGRTAAIKAGVNVATGDYTIIMSSSNTFGPSFVKNALEAIADKQSDIIEFKAVFKEPKKFKGKLRKSFSTPVKIQEHKEVIAYTFPFDFNKLFRTPVLLRAANERTDIAINSRFSIALLYKTFMLSETYSTVAKELVVSKSSISENFNPLKIIRQWKEIIEFEDNKYEGVFTSELMYARYFHEIVFLFGFVGISKNKILLDKLKKNFEKSLKSDFAHFSETNKYMLTENAETALIRQNNTATKLTKIFKNI